MHGIVGLNVCRLPEHFLSFIIAVGLLQGESQEHTAVSNVLDNLKNHTASPRRRTLSSS